jgi:hypothetical protein
MTIRAVSAVLVPPLLCLAGCQQGLETRTFQSRVIKASPEEVFRAAQIILRREFGPLTVESDGHRLVSQRVEYRTSSESGTVRDLYGGPSTMGRIAHFAVAQRGDDTVAGLRIDIERQDTTRQEAFQPDRYRISDAPSQTAIERDAATTTRQNTVWTFVKRDRQLERSLLTELQEQFAPEPAEPGAVQPAADRAVETP